MGEGSRESYWLLHIEFQFYKVKKVLEMDGSDDCTTIPLTKLCT